MGNIITVFKRYRISNAKVKKIPEIYRWNGIKMQWIITAKAILKELHDEHAMMARSFEFTNFSNLGNFIGATRAAVGKYLNLLLSRPICCLLFFLFPFLDSQNRWTLLFSHQLNWYMIPEHRISLICFRCRYNWGCG